MSPPQAHLAPPPGMQSLLTELWDPQLSMNPRKWIQYVYPWGKQGTILEGWKEPRSWQIEAAEEYGDHLAQNKARRARGENPKVFRSSIVSGRGAGKNAWGSWLVGHGMTTWPGMTWLISANGEPQLKAKTWPELAKWFEMGIQSSLFTVEGLWVRPAPWFADLLHKQLKLNTGLYYAVAQLWDESRPDAFAGAHNARGLGVWFDEASGVPQPMWTIKKGFFTEPADGRVDLATSNGRKPSGAFFDCFHKNRDRWLCRSIDSRTVEGADVDELQAVIDEFGPDSDEARIEVYGQFARRGDRQFIGRDLVDQATKRQIITDHGAPLFLGIDVARFGSDSTVFRWRQGRDARTQAPRRFKGLDTVQVAREAAHAIDETKPDAVAIDGPGVVDVLKSWGYRVQEVNFGSLPEDPQYADRGTELWGLLRRWLPDGCVDASVVLERDLTEREYGYVRAEDKIKLESKESMRKRGIPSPDDADALALTFAAKAPRRDSSVSFRHTVRNGRVARDVDYDLFE